MFVAIRLIMHTYSGTILPIVMEIGSYLTDKKHKISLRSFLRHGVVFIDYYQPFVPNHAKLTLL